MMLIDVRLVKEKGDLYVADFARQMYRKCRMCVLVVIAFTDPDKQLNISLYVILQPIFFFQTLLTYIEFTAQS